MNYSDIYFAVLSVATIAVTGLLVLVLFYVIGILHDIKMVSKIAKKETLLIAKGLEKGASLIPGWLSDEAAGFLRTVFTLLLTQFGVVKTRRRSSKTKEV